MDCSKCKGWMVQERCADYFLVWYAWKCLNCGAVVDPTIKKNQRKQLTGSTPESISW